MFVFKPTTQTYSDPVSATFVPGIPFGREFSRGDICLLHEGFSSSKIFLNSKILREAMLNSKDYLEEVLNLKITDVEEKKTKAASAEMYEPEKKATKEAKVEVTDNEPVVVDMEAKPLDEPVAVYAEEVTTKKTKK